MTETVSNYEVNHREKKDETVQVKASIVKQEKGGNRCLVQFQGEFWANGQADEERIVQTIIHSVQSAKLSENLIGSMIVPPGCAVIVDGSVVRVVRP